MPLHKPYELLPDKEVKKIIDCLFNVLSMCLSIVFDAPRGVGVIATTIATFLRSVDASSGVIGGHHPSAHALSYILSPHSLHNGTIGGSGGQSLEYGGFTEENFEGEFQLPSVPTALTTELMTEP